MGGAASGVHHDHERHVPRDRVSWQRSDPAAKREEIVGELRVGSARERRVAQRDEPLELAIASLCSGASGTSAADRTSSAAATTSLASPIFALRLVRVASSYLAAKYTPTRRGLLVQRRSSRPPSVHAACSGSNATCCNATRAFDRLDCGIPASRWSTLPGHGRRGFHRRQPRRRRSFAPARPSRCSTTSSRRASDANPAGSAGNWTAASRPRGRRSRRGRRRAAIAGVDVVYHLAGQTAVTTVGARSARRLRGERARRRSTCSRRRGAARRPPIVLYASTNKVYGGDGRRCRSSRTRRATVPRPPRRRRRDAPARLPLAVRLLEGRRRPVRARLRAASTACRRSSSARPASTARASSASRTRAGSLVRHRRPRSAGRSRSSATASRCATPLRRRSGRRLRARGRGDRHAPRGQAYNIGGGAGATGLGLAGVRAAARAPLLGRRARPAFVRGRAARRPAHLRRRHAKGGGATSAGGRRWSWRRARAPRRVGARARAALRGRHRRRDEGPARPDVLPPARQRADDLRRAARAGARRARSRRHRPDLALRHGAPARRGASTACASSACRSRSASARASSCRRTASRRRGTCAPRRRQRPPAAVRGRALALVRRAAAAGRAVLTYHCDLQLPAGARQPGRGARRRRRRTTSPRRARRPLVAYTQDYADHSPLLRRHADQVVVSLRRSSMPTARVGRGRRSSAPHGLGRRRPVIGFAARFAAEKGIDVAARRGPAPPRASSRTPRSSSPARTRASSARRRTGGA